MTPAAPEDPPPLFTVAVVSWKTAASREINAQRMASMPIRVGVSTAAVSCNACGESWIANNGDRSMRGLIGAIHLKCPSCGRSGTVPTSALESLE